MNYQKGLMTKMYQAAMVHTAKL